MLDGPRQRLETTEAGPGARPRAKTPAKPGSSFRALKGAPTPLDGAEASRHLARAWHAVLGEPVPRAALDLLWAQWALETARGQAMRGNNFGGIKASRGGALLATTEGFGATRERIRARFRTYSTPEEGARDHVTVIAHRFPLALEALRRGDARDFVTELGRGGYFTADPEAYRTGIERLAAEHGGRPLEAAAAAVSVAELVEGVLASLRPRAEGE